MVGINVIGMPFGLHGLGAELRDKVRAIIACDINVCIIERNLSSLSAVQIDNDIVMLTGSEQIYDINLICHNIPAIKMLMRDEPELFEGKYNIAAPYWEFFNTPNYYEDVLQQLDEIWVPNDFLLSVFSGLCDKPILKMPLHLNPHSEVFEKRKLKDGIVFGTHFDASSLFKRKDPYCSLIGFLEAFCHRPKLNVKFLMKFKFEDNQLVKYSDIEDLRRLASMDKRIELIEGALPTEEMNSIVSKFDVFVSTHRSEGLGRGIVQGLLDGLAVISSGYSGPGEFLSEDHSIILDTYQTHVGEAAIGDIQSWYTWEEVELNSVISAFSAIADAPKLVEELGTKARKAMSVHGSVAFGSRCKARISEISF